MVSAFVRQQHFHLRSICLKYIKWSWCTTLYYIVRARWYEDVNLVFVWERDRDIFVWILGFYFYKILHRIYNKYACEWLECARKHYKKKHTQSRTNGHSKLIQWHLFYFILSFQSLRFLLLLCLYCYRWFYRFQLFNHLFFENTTLRGHTYRIR